MLVHISTVSYSLFIIYIFLMGRDVSVGTATTLGTGRSGDRMPVGAGFSAPDQTQLHSYTVVTGSFPGVKRAEGGVDLSAPSRAEVKEKV